MPLLPPLDLPTILAVSCSIAAMIGFFLLFAWLRDPSMRALAWWGGAYLVGSVAMALWHMPLPFPRDTAGALLLIACGMVWNGVRVFYGRRLLPLAICAGALIWILSTRFLGDAGYKLIVAAVIVSSYAFCVMVELRRDRRRAQHSRLRLIFLPLMHAAIFLLPFGLNVISATGVNTEDASRLFALETMIYAVGIAFIVLLAVKDQQIQLHKTAAETDPLTGLFNRRAFLLAAEELRGRSTKRREPVGVLMFDLDRFKSINDRFGHAVGDEVIKRFAETVAASLRATDIVGRLGGEEFAAIIPGGRDVAALIGERVRANFEIAGVQFREFRIEATVSIGAACTVDAAAALADLLERADAALYRAKTTGRNRVEVVQEPSCHPVARHIATARARSILPIAGQLPG